MQRIHTIFQGNCVTFRGFGDEWQRQAATSVECSPVCGNMRGPTPRRNADLLSWSTEAPVRTISPARWMPLIVVGRSVHPASGRHGHRVGRRGLACPYSAARRRNTYAASSMAKIAVSGWLIGSTPTRLTIEVIVPSASASTHAARCSSPK